MLRTFLLVVLALCLFPAGATAKSFMGCRVVLRAPHGDGLSATTVNWSEETAAYGPSVTWQPRGTSSGALLQLGYSPKLGPLGDFGAVDIHMAAPMEAPKRHLAIRVETDTARKWDFTGDQIKYDKVPNYDIFWSEGVIASVFSVVLDEADSSSLVQGLWDARTVTITLLLGEKPLVVDTFDLADTRERDTLWERARKLIAASDPTACPDA